MRARLCVYLRCMHACARASVHAGVCVRACERACRVCLWALLSLASVWAGDVPELYPIECTRFNLRLWQILPVKNYSVLCPLTLHRVSLQPLPAIPFTGDPATQHLSATRSYPTPQGHVSVRMCEHATVWAGVWAIVRVNERVCRCARGHLSGTGPGFDPTTNSAYPPCCFALGLTLL